MAERIGAWLMSENRTKSPVFYASQKIKEERMSRMPHREDRPEEECAVFGVNGVTKAGELTLTGLHRLQHRGQNSSGIATYDETVHIRKGKGLAKEVFPDGAGDLTGETGMGHNRYATSGGARVGHAQPVHINEGGIEIMLAHNGNIPVTDELKKFLTSNNYSYAGLSDSEMVAKAIWIYMRDGLSVEDALKETYPKITGAFSMLVMHKHTLIGIRDFCGIRPLSVGTLPGGGSAFSSETCALDLVRARNVRDVKPGEMVITNGQGMRSVQIVEGVEKLDAFEFVYFADEKSILLGKRVRDVRKDFGKELGKEFIKSAGKEYRSSYDVVVSIPNTAIPIAEGFTGQTGIPYAKDGIQIFDKEKYTRTFLGDSEAQREEEVDQKFFIKKKLVAGKRVLVMDDSIVRGTTSKKVVEMLREAGASEIHFFSGSPEYKNPDFYGTHTPQQGKLIAHAMTPTEMKEYLGVDSLHFLSLAGFVRAIGVSADKLSMPYFNGKYPMDIGKNIDDIEGLPSQRFIKPLARLPVYKTAGTT